MTVQVNLPGEIIKRYHDEALKQIRRDLANVDRQNITKPKGLLSNRAAAWNLGFINSCAQRDETGGDTLFPLIVRNRELEDLEKTAEAVVEILQCQGFTVSEALMFLKHIESMVLASPVKY